MHSAFERISVAGLGHTYAHKTCAAYRNHKAISLYRIRQTVYRPGIVGIVDICSCIQNILGVGISFRIKAEYEHIEIGMLGIFVSDIPVYFSNCCLAAVGGSDYHLAISVVKSDTIVIYTCIVAKFTVRLSPLHFHTSIDIRCFHFGRAEQHAFKLDVCHHVR